MMLAITLFRLKPGREVEAYREYSNRFIKPGMVAMPAVHGFRDFQVECSYDGAEPSAMLIELIEIESIEAFKRDNENPPGGDVAADWENWVESSEVLFCQEITP